MAKKGKLHELLAVEGDLENAAKKIMGETIQTFTKKQDHFSAFIRTLTMFDENRQNENTTDRSELTTTVDEKLDYTQLPVVRWFDALLQKEATNQLAKADLVVSVGYGIPTESFASGVQPNPHTAPEYQVGKRRWHGKKCLPFCLSGGSVQDREKVQGAGLVRGKVPQGRRGWTVHPCSS